MGQPETTRRGFCAILAGAAGAAVAEAFAPEARAADPAPPPMPKAENVTIFSPETGYVDLSRAAVLLYLDSGYGVFVQAKRQPDGSAVAEYRPGSDQFADDHGEPAVVLAFTCADELSERRTLVLTCPMVVNAGMTLTIKMPPLELSKDEPLRYPQIDLG